MNNLDKSCFAYQSMRKYPIHTKEAALNSYKEFCADKDTIPGVLAKEIQDRFDKAAAYHEVSLDSVQKEASEAREELFFATGTDAAIKMSKIASKDDLYKASTFILEKRASMPRKMLKEAAKYVLWSAANSEDPVDTLELRKIAQIAGIGVGDRAEIQNELEKRATLNIFTGKDKEEFWKYANELKNLSDDDFYKEATLNNVCDVLELTDMLYNNQHKYGKELKYPEEVCFGQNLDDLLKEASDLAYIPSIDTTISKKALLEREDKVNSFFSEYFGAVDALHGDDLVTKVASLDKTTAISLLDSIE